MADTPESSTSGGGPSTDPPATSSTSGAGAGASAAEEKKTPLDRLKENYASAVAQKNEILRLITTDGDKTQAKTLYKKLRKFEGEVIKKQIKTQYEKNEDYTTYVDTTPVLRFTTPERTDIIDRTGQIRESIFQRLSSGAAYQMSSIPEAMPVDQGDPPAEAKGGSTRPLADAKDDPSAPRMRGKGKAEAKEVDDDNPDYMDDADTEQQEELRQKMLRRAKQDEAAINPDGSTAPARETSLIAQDYMKNLPMGAFEDLQAFFDEKRRDGGDEYDEKSNAALHKVISTLGEEYILATPEEKQTMMYIFFNEMYKDTGGEAHGNLRAQAKEPAPDAPEAMDTPETVAAGTQNLRGAPDVAEPKTDPVAPAAQPEVPVVEGDKAPFTPSNPTYRDANIEVDDSTGQGVFGATGGIPLAGAMGGLTGTAAASTAGQLTASGLMNSISFPTDEAQKLIEDRQRNRKTIKQLKDEIKCFHTIYDDQIPEFKAAPHQGDKDDALASNDIKKVKDHHRKMQNTIRNYFKTSDLKVGVILSAESFFGTQHGAAPNLAALAQPRPFGATPGNVRVSKPGHEFDNAVAGEVRVNRLGRNYKKPVSRNVPKVAVPPTPQQVNQPPVSRDVERPLLAQRGFRRRPYHRGNTGIPVVLKTKKQ